MPYRMILRSAFALVLALLPVHAHACMGYDLEDSLLFETIPPEARDADIIASVTLDIPSSENHDAIATEITARVTEVKKGNIQPGDVILLQFRKTSCGPNHHTGEHGIIAGMIKEGDEKKAAIHPFVHKRSGDNVNVKLSY